MSKLSVTLEGATVQEVSINKSKFTIGRRPTNDVVLNHLGISGTHAVIEAKANDYFLEDLGSTNGTKVNGQRIKRHFLQNGDMISIAKYKLKFHVDFADKVVPPASSESQGQHAFVRVLDGINEGKELPLNKELTKLGTPNIQVANISRANNTYYLTHIEGLQATLLNEVDIGSEVRELKEGDVIDLSGTHLMFHY